MTATNGPDSSPIDRSPIDRSPIDPSFIDSSPKDGSPTEPSSVEEPITGGIETLISRVLRVGVLLSVALMLVGLVIGLAQGSIAPPPTGSDAIDASAMMPRTPAELWSSVTSGEASGLVALGVFTLVCTPLVRVIASLWAYSRARDRTYMLLTLTVLVLLGVSVLVGAA